LRALLDDERFRRGDTDTAYLEQFVAEENWQALPDLNDLPAELPPIITAVLYAHARQGGGRAVVTPRGGGGNPWVEAGRREAMR
ncbi:MAG: hypothetical protein ACYS6Z_08255, partial [Planctomycetota bacterium]